MEFEYDVVGLGTGLRRAGAELNGLGGQGWEVLAVFPFGGQLAAAVRRPAVEAEVAPTSPRRTRRVTATIED